MNKAQFCAALAVAIDNADTAQQKLDELAIAAKRSGLASELRAPTVAALIKLGWSKATAYRKVSKVLGLARTVNQPKRVTLASATNTIRKQIDAAVAKLAKGDKALAKATRAALIAKL